MATYRDYFSEIKKRVKEATPQQVADLLRSGDIQLADVREKNEWDEGHLPNAVHLPKSYVEQWAEDRIPDKDKTTILYCAGGVRSVMAADALAKLGYSHVISMSGGFNRWKDSGLPWKKPDAGLTPEQGQRYSRHLLIPEVGEAGQLQLLRSKVLLIGAGGLGSPAALYLAAAGVGTLGIVDSDVVDATNLQRQILHTTERVGEPKTESARITLEALNPDVKIVGYQERLTSENIDRILSEYDVVVDGADNFPTRYLLNDASVKHNKPVVHGSIYRFEGQVTVFKPREGPCYRCPRAPRPACSASCRGSSALSRRTKSSSSCSGSGSRSSGATYSSTRSKVHSARCACAATQSARSAARTRPSPSTSTTRASAPPRPSGRPSTLQRSARPPTSPFAPYPE